MRRLVCALALAAPLSLALAGCAGGGGPPKPNKRQIAMIDRVLVKNISELTQDDLKGENPDIANVTDVIEFLQSIYNKKIQCTDTVSVVYFSEIIE